MMTVCSYRSHTVPFKNEFISISYTAIMQPLAKILSVLG